LHRKKKLFCRENKNLDARKTKCSVAISRTKFIGTRKHFRERKGKFYHSPNSEIIPKRPPEMIPKAALSTCYRKKNSAGVYLN